MKVWEVRDKVGLDALSLGERSQPQPGPGQILLKLHAASLNYRDLLVVKGVYGPTKPRPLIPFSDGAGEVVAVGDAVTRVKVGDRVAGIFMQTWLEGPFSAGKADSALGGAIDGMLAEYVTLSEQGVVPIPDHLSYAEAATLPCAAVTAWNALTTDGNLKAGDTVLIQGTGGVSLFALQFCNLMGVRVIGTSSRDRKIEQLKQLGAVEVINYKTVPNWEEEVWELTHRVGVDRVIEVGGAGTLNQSLRATCAGGHISLIGVLAGIKAEVNTALILHKCIHLKGIYVGNRAMFEAMNRALSQHKMRPIIDRVFPVAEVRKALEYMESGAHFGKIVLQF